MLLCPQWGPSEPSRAEWFLHLHSLRKWLPSLCLHTDNYLAPQHSSYCTLAVQPWFYPTHPVPHIHTTWPNVFIPVGLKVDVKLLCCRLLKQPLKEPAQRGCVSSIHFSSYVNSSTGRSNLLSVAFSSIISIHFNCLSLSFTSTPVYNSTVYVPLQHKYVDVFSLLITSSFLLFSLRRFLPLTKTRSKSSSVLPSLSQSARTPVARQKSLRHMQQLDCRQDSGAGAGVPCCTLRHWVSLYGQLLFRQEQELQEHLHLDENTTARGGEELAYTQPCLHPGSGVVVTGKEKGYRPRGNLSRQTFSYYE